MWAQEFVEGHGLAGFEHLDGIDDGLTETFDVAYSPTFVFLNDDGTEKRRVGDMSARSLKREVERLLSS